VVEAEAEMAVTILEEVEEEANKMLLMVIMVEREEEAVDIRYITPVNGLALKSGRAWGKMKER
jgi:hypothetical protein